MVMLGWPQYAFNLTAVSHAVLNSLVTDSSHKAFLAQTQRAAKGNSRAKGEGRLCEAV